MCDLDDEVDLREMFRAVLEELEFIRKCLQF